MPEDTARRLAEIRATITAPYVDDTSSRQAAIHAWNEAGLRGVLEFIDAQQAALDALTAERDALRRQLQELWAPSWSCEDCGWPWPMSTPPASTDECDSCGGPMKEDDDA